MARRGPVRPGRAADLVKITLPGTEPRSHTASVFEFAIDRERLRQVRRREGRYLLRTNLTTIPRAVDVLHPAHRGRAGVQGTQARPGRTPDLPPSEERIEAHIFVAFLAYCLQVTLKAKLKRLATASRRREVIAKFKTMQMVDVHVPTTDGRELVLSRYTQPEADHRMLLRPTAAEAARATPAEDHRPQARITAQAASRCSGDLRGRAQSNQALSAAVDSGQLRKTG